MLGRPEAGDSTVHNSAVTSEPPIVSGASFIGQRCGAYKIVREIGRGGMGMVYLAGRVDDEFKQRVALKILRTGIDAEEILRRFRHERQILASLDHPNIARLLDGGSTATGEPYLVMDFVEGIPLDQFCDGHRHSIAERIEIFRQLCAAVQYVHQNLIIHRDLKPGNVLVRSDGVVKLLDFGIAKILKPDMMANVADATRVNELLMTPAYASPEQARGEPISTVSDVYSLGVMLYELLTGRRPYRPRTSGTLELVRSICEDEPQKPSTIVTRSEKGTLPTEASLAEVSRNRSTVPAKLGLRLRGDLDNILLKALRKEPQRRYASVEQFSADLQRHLRNQPVLAHEDSLSYRAGKFVQRNAIAVTAAALTALALVTGVIATAHEARIALAERARAESRFQDVRKLATTMLFDVNDSIKNLPGSTPARSLIANTSTEYLDRLSKASQGDVSLQQELTEGYLRVGDVQGNPFDANLGHTKAAISSFRSALALATSVAAARPEDIKARQLVARSHLALGSVLAFDGEPKEAFDHAGQAVKIFEQLAAAQPNDVETRFSLSGAYELRGDIEGGAQGINLGRTADAMRDYEKSLEVEPVVPADSSFAARSGRGRAVMMIKIGQLQGRTGHWPEALANFQEALPVAQSLSSADPNNQRARALVSAILNQLANAQASLGNSAAAQANYLKAEEINEAALKADPTNSQAAANLMVTMKNQGDLYFHELQKWPDALRCYRRTGALLEAQASQDPENRLALDRLAVNDTYIASTLLRLGQPAEARRNAKAGLALAKRIADSPNATPALLYDYAWLATTVEPDDLQTPALALPYARRAVELDGGRDPLSLKELADAYAGTGDYAAAVATLEKADALFSPATGKNIPVQQNLVRQDLADFRSKLQKTPSSRPK